MTIIGSHVSNFQTAPTTSLRAQAKQSSFLCGSEGSWIASSQVLLAMTLRYDSAFPRRDASGFCIYLSPSKGAGNAGRSMHPQPCVQK
jgi:hypothetical protein